jgi:hypothetical protein
MRVSTAILVCSVLATAWFPLFAAADDPPMLVHNPFSRPPSEVTRVRDSVIERDDGDGTTLDLQATMIGGMSRLANVAGRILKPGDEIEGYELIAVYERYAVFRRNNEMMTVHVKPNLAEDDE